jgi:hypothetical protein
MSQPGSKKTVQPKTIEIQVTNDKCIPDSAPAYNIDSVKWTGDDVTELYFPDEDPFLDGKGNKFKPNKVYKIKKLKGTFKYNVATSSGTYDPEIVVDPPPPGG